MSIPINTDNSVQLSYSSFPFTVADIDNYATSNFVSNVSNVLRTAINTKQDTLTAATTLLGVGTSITAIDYTKVSVNKPTNFQADWNSTIINKPTIYTQSQIDTFLNAKQNNLTAATTLLGTGGSITGINYNTVINKPSYSTPLSSNIATNTISIDLTNYYNQTQVNTAIGNTSNYSLNISNILKANIDTKDAILSFTSPLIRTVNTITFSESAITTLTNFYNKTEANNLLNAKQATLSFTSPLVNTANTINFNESAITTLTNFYNKTETNNLLNAKQATLTFSSPLVNTANTISINLGAYSTTGTDTNYLLKSGGTMTGALTTPNITLGGATGRINVVDDYHYIDFNQNNDTTTIQEYGTIKFNIGQTKTTKAYVNSSGLTATAFYGDGANITGVPYSTITGKPTTFPADLTNYYNQTQTNTIITNTSNYASNISNVLLINYNSLNINSSNYASNISNIIITNTNANYLKLSGGTMTAGANIITTGNIRAGSLTAGETTYQLLINPPTATTSSLIQTILQGSGYNQKLTLQALGGNVGIGNTNPSQILQVGDGARLRIANGPTDYSLIGTKEVDNADNTRIVVSGKDRTTYNGNIDYVATSTGAHQFYSGSETLRMRINNLGNVGIGIANANTRLHIEHASTSSAGNSGGLYVYNPNNAASHCSVVGIRIAGALADKASLSFDVNGVAGWSIYIKGNDANTLRFNNGWAGTGTDILAINNSGATINGTLYINGNVGIGTQPTLQKLEVNGPTNITGSLSVQSADLHTFKSPGGLGGNFNCAGYITCLLYAITNSGTDYVGVGNASSGNNNNYLRQLYIMFETFTGFHRCFTNDELFDNENPQNFKDTYIGRIVVSTGKIATDFKSIDNDEWEIKYDKEGITIEDALPMIELSRKKKDKRVFGVLGNSKRNNSRSERLVINSVGEGGIWICNSNGNIENGDYITSSDYLGYGEKQDDDLLHNYTVAKATMDCDFQLDSPLYNCIEIQEGLRIAFIAATYHSG